MSRRNSLIAGYEQHTTRMTRARAATFQAKSCVEIAKPPLPKPDIQKKPNVLKRVAVDENDVADSAPAPKRRAVLRDVTNICCGSLYKSCIDASKPQFNSLQKVKPGSKLKFSGSKKGLKLPASSINGNMLLLETKKDKKVGGTHVLDTTALPDTMLPVTFKRNNNFTKQDFCEREGSCESVMHDKRTSRVASEHICSPDIVKEEPSRKFTSKDNHGYIDIDLNHKNPHMCSTYAADIYDAQRADELNRRPIPDFMETIQHDITQSMRAILIDWLVEVAGEYHLTAETLYLTVSLIDQFLSQNAVEKQSLQLLGVTCLLIAAKYEEISAPRIEEFCLITDNTYKKKDVLRMESKVLNYLNFRLCFPTIQTFLRRFILAGQASYKAPSSKLEHLACYLAELTLTEYGFVSFLPSIVAASAVFLSRWTLNQSDHPWNSTLEHYTSYTALDLKDTVIEMQNLQANKKKSTLHAIRDKYRQSSFYSVALLPTKELPGSLF